MYDTNPNPAEQGADDRTGVEWVPTYSLFSLLLITLVCAVMAAGLRLFVVSLQNDAPGAWRGAFVVFIVAAPTLLLVVVSAVYHVVRQFAGNVQGHSPRDQNAWGDDV
ncbi:MAG: hypothetical protein R3E01_21550 [Pirellulaceae bacterium]|nr:hypothetical protein [Planctomycetales bacterium]